jgi:hypothetical protein
MKIAVKILSKNQFDFVKSRHKLHVYCGPGYYSINQNGFRYQCLNHDGFGLEKQTNLPFWLYKVLKKYIKAS